MQITKVRYNGKRLEVAGVTEGGDEMGMIYGADFVPGEAFINAFQNLSHDALDIMGLSAMASVETRQVLVSYEDGEILYQITVIVRAPKIPGAASLTTVQVSSKPGPKMVSPIQVERVESVLQLARRILEEKEGARWRQVDLFEGVGDDDE